ncbi:bifunctional 4-hydroxy-2-oxoglutarate aldolase/2-dehydro-3-deoxy-phosphogluconate aldolase [Antarcticimicrobium sediminis]|uniref:2-dehydro-3-deoxy-phosphogluconate aldolase n=1 Tax=Antarcticimicrobium sediminis TaxID=2546227 RepID=A0A4R5ELS1_9RHOB|nr:bifunctional 4-hydroxy-2-oxoglutarate aldolase/2-dehydro-3-deoxy-phosphogluconate aldolase [Antarcticimicrobium sediminis]TDE35619.1 bifunctional 4-hydroxy-2-oxoglutarate aldolase/2-dehydro-3-deoxy-phosphogluconate aldolase [Antarcticimicrobium sediminis]
MAIDPVTASHRMRALGAMAPVIPVLVVEDAAQARPLAEALVAGGLPVLEVTLRTPAAPEVIRQMCDVPGAIVGAGTVITPADVQIARAAGAQFAVSPGATDALLAACEAADLPLLPGAVTASEAMVLLARGYDLLKFFPAEAAGGVAVLKALAAPLPQISFCPTGGVSPTNARDYLALSTVPCVGGSWVTPKSLLAAGDWPAIRALAQQARHLGK